MSCIFCSVDEGPYSRTRKLDYVVDVDYLMKWFDEVARIKGKGLEAHLYGQGEPLIYPFRVELVQALREHPNVSVISMQSRLFNKEKCKFNDREVHESVECDNVGELKNYVLHYAYENIEEFIDKQNRYSSIGAKPNKIKAIFSPYWTFFKIYFLKFGFLDGWMGFVIARLYSEYTFWKYIKGKK
jgi:hypothetical protein